MMFRLALHQLAACGVALAGALGCQATTATASPGLAALATTAPPSTVTVAPVPSTEPGDETGAITPKEAARTPDVTSFCGGWQETWAVNEETDVHYRDIYLVDVHGSELTFTSPANPQYEFRRVVRHPSHLEVELVNHSSGEEFVIVYEMTLDQRGTAMNGVATTPEKQVTIRWDRITPEAVDAELGAGVSEALACLRKSPPIGH